MRVACVLYGLSPHLGFFPHFSLMDIVPVS